LEGIAAGIDDLAFDADHGLRLVAGQVPDGDFVERLEGGFLLLGENGVIGTDGDNDRGVGLLGLDLRDDADPAAGPADDGFRFVGIRAETSRDQDKIFEGQALDEGIFAGFVDEPVDGRELSGPEGLEGIGDDPVVAFELEVGRRVAGEEMAEVEGNHFLAQLARDFTEDMGKLEKDHLPEILVLEAAPREDEIVEGGVLGEDVGSRLLDLAFDRDFLVLAPHLEGRIGEDDVELFEGEILFGGGGADEGVAARDVFLVEVLEGEDRQALGEVVGGADEIGPAQEDALFEPLGEGDEVLDRHSGGELIKAGALDPAALDLDDGAAHGHVGEDCDFVPVGEGEVFGGGGGGGGGRWGGGGGGEEAFQVDVVVFLPGVHLEALDLGPLEVGVRGEPAGEGDQAFEAFVADDFVDAGPFDLALDGNGFGFEGDDDVVAVTDLVFLGVDLACKKEIVEIDGIDGAGGRAGAADLDLAERAGSFNAAGVVEEVEEGRYAGTDGVGTLFIDLAYDVDKDFAGFGELDVDKGGALGGILGVDVRGVDLGEAFGDEASKVAERDAVGVDAPALVRDVDKSVLADGQGVAEGELAPDGDNDLVAGAQNVEVVHGAFGDLLGFGTEDVVAEGDEGGGGGGGRSGGGSLGGGWDRRRGRRRIGWWIAYCGGRE